MSDDSLLSLGEAARLLATPGSDPHDVEVRLAEAIESGSLHASVKRWATEQWEGRMLPGNINRRETFIERSALQHWQAGGGR
ncbi:MAG: hypothetical protein F9K30_05545 [Dechloromonas sp.]|nr:MAG: hypothetical protein F9K30_05545 [Dechloromonas sp.]